MNYKEKALKIHKDNKGKIEVNSKTPLNTKEDLALLYSPGVAEPCKEIHENELNIYEYTSKGNMVAVITDGTAVLGLGNIGPKAALPVMEGKAILFKTFAGVDAFPICLDTTDTEEIIRTCKLLSPSFGGINLEDISAPRCIEIETRLKTELDIPVFHDDQHGTAIVTLAAIINSLKIVNKEKEQIKICICGTGAAGSSIIKMLYEYGIKDIVAVDEYGILNKDKMEDYDFLKKDLLNYVNKKNIRGTLKDAIKDTDIFIGVSVGGIVSKDMIKSMNTDPIVLAMANPTPEIMPELAIEAGAKIVGTGRSDYPNQVNNVLAFPGIFRGALDAKAKKITKEMMLAASMAIANYIPQDKLSYDNIIPDAMDKGVARSVAASVKSAVK
ncbi:NADP-dependent malic enzyme [Mycoplasmatota bacterium]|nr:NADP-dependent malic enzyme [Mycoplasmatota bacterium]